MVYLRSSLSFRITSLLLSVLFVSTCIPGIAIADPGTAPVQAAAPVDPATVPTNLLPDAERTAFEKLMADVQRLDTELEIAVEEYNAATVLLTETDQYLTDMQEELDIAQAEYEARKGIMDERLSALYKNGHVNFIEVFLNTKSFSDFLVRLSFMINISLNDSHMLSELEAAKTGVENTKSELEGLRAQQLAYQQEMDGKKQAIEEKLSLRKNLLDNTSSDMLNLIRIERERRSREAANLLAKAKSELYGGINATKNPFVETAFKYIGIPYVWGGASAKGMDCSGLVMLVMAEYGIGLPHYSRYQSMMGMPIDDGTLKPGDLVFFGEPIHHVGIYIGGDYYIHAPKTGDVVKVSVLSERSDFATARRFVPLASAAQVQ